MGHRQRTLRMLVPIALLLLCAEALPETPASSLYLRDVATHRRALEILDGRTMRRKSEAVLIVFDTVTFAPPPRLNEFRLVQDYSGDIEKWLTALEEWHVRAPGNVWLATTTSASPHRLGAPGWRAAIDCDLQRSWWEGNFSGFSPATTWMSRLLQKVPGARRTLCLITGELVPERLADVTRDRNAGLLPTESWRQELLPVGSYWNEEAVGSYLKSRDTVLDLIAPEVRFCDFWPLQELPELPWVSRPRIPVVPGAPPESQTRRFQSRTPMGQTLCGSYVFFNTDVPSGFGYWPFARAAAITDGGYIFYPFGKSNFLDPCPYDPILMKYLAPEPGSLSEIMKSKAGDPALAALLDASKLVMAKTPWHDGPPRAKGWAGLSSVNPPTREDRYRERDKPYTYVAMAYMTPGAAESRGKEIARLLPLYDQAIADLKKVQAAIAAGEVPRPHRRSRASLRLGIYWFTMSAFHLHSLSLYLEDIRKNIPEDRRRTMKEFAVIFDRCIRMSDCLPSYDGRSISREYDLELQAGQANPACGPQGNILPLPGTDPDYRALRHPGEVLKNLDPRLMSRALSMIDAAQDVMRHEGRSPFGWVVYYSVAIDYTWFGVPPVLRGSRRVGEDDPSGVPTPRPRTNPGGPSSGK